MLSQEAARQEFVKGATVPQVTDLAVPCLQAACGVACWLQFKHTESEWILDLFGEASMITAARDAATGAKPATIPIEDEKKPHDAGEENDESESATDDKAVD